MVYRSIPLVVCSALAVALLAARCLYAANLTYTFLVWNLVLAWIPYLLGLWIEHQQRPHALTLGLWLLFFPNAPYILTDLVHLRARAGSPLWYDVGLLAIFALSGLVLGIRSLEVVHDQVRRRFGCVAGWATVSAAATLSGLGIYVGRVLRWNSWDAVLRPRAVLSNIASHLLEPDVYPAAWGVTLVFGAILLATYLALQPTTRDLPRTSPSSTTCRGDASGGLGPGRRYVEWPSHRDLSHRGTVVQIGNAPRDK